MNRKAIYAEAKRLSRRYLGVFTPDALRAHLMRSGGVIGEEVAMDFEVGPVPQPVSAGGAWSTASTESITESLRKLRQMAQDQPYRPPPPLTINLLTAAFGWASLSRYSPKYRHHLRIRLGDGRWWDGELTARTA